MVNRRRIILPAAGSATRFGGIPKELLPVNPQQSCLQKAVELADKFGNPVVVSNVYKFGLHRTHLHKSVEIHMRPNPEWKDLWGSILFGLKKDTPGGLILPDTVTDVWQPSIVKGRCRNGGIGFGLFSTVEPHRFSVVLREEIFTKEISLVGEYLAWGMVFWSEEVTNFWLECGDQFDHYDRAFEAAMRKFDHWQFRLAEYDDIGNFQAYLNYLNRTNGTPNP